jgi:DNA-binding MarR family transcriptional regulator
MAEGSGGNTLNQDIFDAMTAFFGQLVKHGEQLAGQLDVPMFCVKALRRLDDSISMKELGRRMACDPSFVTMIADALEQRGLARREPSAADRRIKNLVLTPEGVERKRVVDQALLGQMPWAQALDVSERETLLALTRKMLSALAVTPGPCIAAQPGAASDTMSTAAGEVSDTTGIAVPAAS